MVVLVAILILVVSVMVELRIILVVMIDRDSGSGNLRHAQYLQRLRHSLKDESAAPICRTHVKIQLHTSGIRAYFTWPMLSATTSLGICASSDTPVFTFNRERAIFGY